MLLNVTLFEIVRIFYSLNVVILIHRQFLNYKCDIFAEKSRQIER